MTTTSTLSQAAGRYYTLRGLLLVPLGILFVATGLLNPPVGDEDVPSHTNWLLLVFLAVGVALVLVNRYYVTTFGRVRPLTSTKLKVGVYSGIAAVAVGLGAVVDTQADLPISLYGAGYAIALLLYYRSLVGLATYHWIFLGGLAVVSLLPVWGVLDDKLSPGLVAIGVASIGVGWFDHRALLQTFEAPSPVEAVAPDA